VFGNYRKASVAKKGYHLLRNQMDCADLARLINSDQVQSKLRAIQISKPLHYKKKNPLKNKSLMRRLNPYEESRKEAERKTQAHRHTKRGDVIKAKRSKASKVARAARSAAYNGIQEGMKDAFVAAEKKFKEYDAIAGQEEAAEE